MPDLGQRRVLIGSLVHEARWASLLLVCACGAGCSARLASDLTEAQANEIIVTLQAAGVPAEKELAAKARGDVRYDIEVPEREVGRALSLLSAAALPRRDEGGIEEAFAEGGLVPTATEERARLVSAIGGELARTIERIDGVVDARVHVALAEPREASLDETPPSPRASVLIKHRIDHAAPDAESIRAMVAGAVQGMDPAAVAVLTVIAEPPLDEPRLTHVGPFSVSLGSAPLLKGALAASLAVHVLLATLLVVILRRQRRP